MGAMPWLIVTAGQPWVTLRSTIACTRPASRAAGEPWGGTVRVSRPATFEPSRAKRVTSWPRAARPEASLATRNSTAPAPGVGVGRKTELWTKIFMRLRQPFRPGAASTASIHQQHGTFGIISCHQGDGMYSLHRRDDLANNESGTDGGRG